MRIVNRATFLAMPQGTVYAKIETRWIIGDMCVKYESTAYNDWYYKFFSWVDADDSSQAFDRLDEMADNGASYPIDKLMGRDGLFDEDGIFLIYEPEDIKHIVAEITQGDNK